MPFKNSRSIIITIYMSLSIIFYIVLFSHGTSKATDYITGINAPLTLFGKESTATLWSKVSLPDGIFINRVWAEIEPPLQTEVFTLELIDPDSDGKYEITYSNFSLEGIYKIVINTEDTGGFIDQSEPTAVIHKKEDRYENDNTSEYASVIQIDDPLPQSHTFHQQGDEDWMTFLGVSDIAYAFMAVNNHLITSNAVIEIYDTDRMTMLAKSENNDATAGGNISLNWICPGNDIYYVKLLNHNPVFFGMNVGYEFEISRKIAAAGYIVGTVTDISGSPVNKTRIKTNGDGANLSKENGSYLIRHDPGIYNIYAEAEGYAPFKSEITIETQASTINKDINLMPLMGDINNDREVNLGDIISVLKIASGENYQTVYIQADVNGDNLIGLEEAVYGLIKIAESNGK